MKKNMLSIATVMVVAISFHGCGESTKKTESNNEVKIDRANYYPKSSETRNWIEISENITKRTRDTNYFDEKIVLTNNFISYETNNTIHTKLEIKNDEIKISYPNRGTKEIENRNVALGGIIFSNFSSSTQTIDGISKNVEKTKECILEKRLNGFKADIQLEISYTGEILREKCTIKEETTFSNQNKTHVSIDIKYRYIKKGKGYLAFIDKNCYLLNKEYSNDNQLFYDLNDSSLTCDRVLNMKNLLLK